MSAQATRRSEVAAFIVSLYQDYLARLTADGDIGPLAGLPEGPAHASDDLLADCHAVARVLARARNNIHVLQWDAALYANSLPRTTVGTPKQEEELLKQFPPLAAADCPRADDEHLPVMDEGCVFCDVVGRILCWFLPAALPERHQRILFEATAGLSKRLTSVHVDDEEPITKKWRQADRLFTEGKSMKSGQVFFGPAWFEQGHLPPKYSPIVLSATKTEEASAWMSAIQETGCLLDGILAATHPSLYDAGRNLMERLYSDGGLARDIVEMWPSVYHAVHVIVNRETIYHRDLNGLPGWYDMLVSVGDYGEAAILSAKTLGQYEPRLSCLLGGPGVLARTRSGAAGKRNNRSSEVEPNYHKLSGPLQRSPPASAKAGMASSLSTRRSARCLRPTDRNAPGFAQGEIQKAEF
ncbi:hypothetical protein C8Q76DRAFT_696335 [Earliella scabrosa]|nr:hypothetical protein C8Q76DRAFT_696335 [Earliella scabrosa]